jgi:hypothetical protein
MAFPFPGERFGKEYTMTDLKYLPEKVVAVFRPGIRNTFGTGLGKDVCVHHQKTGT